ncbi:restriction endonuclease subunit S [Leuconostoc mesenteroides]|uniref:restriction endonuclease subunit S n=1 Tax=Leuconostoc mesenteroides TaxID=1245 RepID=UPI0023607940|nr:restriction endonuclease subunit S [Leuconostoc mesenteroides]
MQTKKRKSPSLRFRGYTDDWEERKLGEIFNYEQPTKYIVKSTEYDDNFNTPVLTAGKSFLLGYTDEISGIKNATVENPVVIFDDFTTGSHYVDFPFKIKSSAMKLLSLNDNSDNFYFMFNTLKNIKYVPQSHERHWISKFSEFEIYKPSQEEQQKIGSFFKQLDDTIALHQRKLDLLKEQKKGCLQKMFPKNGAKIPELRFAGFADDWEQRKLGDFVIDYVEKTTTQNQFPVLTSSQQQGIVLQETYFANRQVTTDNNIGYYVLPRGYFTFRNRSDNDVFIFNRNDLIDKGIISYFYPVFTLKNSDSDFFLKRINNGIKRQVSIQAEGTGQHVLSMKKFKNIISMFPSLEEQEKIGSFFKQLDNTIALHQRKLDLLKEQKKGFLQKMFV